jgi:hypothetical protein
MVLGESLYKSVDLDYKVGSKRSFLCYSAMNKFHAEEDFNNFRANPILDKLLYKYLNHISSRTNLWISPKKRLSTAHINGAAVPVFDKNDIDTFGKKCSREILLLARSIKKGDKDKNSYDEL